MSLKKQYLKTREVCKVTFRIPSEIGKDYKNASVVGDFNNWSKTIHKMKKLKKDGSFSILIELPKGTKYQFRYLLDGTHWTNESEADSQVATPYGDSENSILIL